MKMYSEVLLGWAKFFAFIIFSFPVEVFLEIAIKL